MHQRDQERIKIRPLIEKIIRGNKYPQNIVAPHHCRCVAEIMHIKSGRLQDELIEEHLAAERLCIKRQQRKQPNGEPRPPSLTTAQTQRPAALLT